MEVTLSPIVTVRSDEQESNALSPMEVTLFGMVTVLSDIQESNAYTPMEVTLSGMVTCPLASGVYIQSAWPRWHSSRNVAHTKWITWVAIFAVEIDCRL
jgi:hypothetical protein